MKEVIKQTPSLMKQSNPEKERKNYTEIISLQHISSLIARNAKQPSRTRRKSPLHPRKSTYPDEPAVPPYESYPH
jgi:hypothetical protein